MSQRVSLADEAITPKVLRHSRELLTLAWPVMLSRAGILIMAFVDIVMLGRYGEGAVGVSNLGLAIFVPFMVVSIGLCSGMIPVISRAYGAGDWRECGHGWRRALSWGVFVSIFAMIIVWHGENWLRLFGQTEDLSVQGGAVAIALAPGLLAQVLYAVCAFYLESTGRPFPALGAMVIANLVNAALNWVMIFGNLGFPETGAVGAAIASTIARFIAAGLLIALILGQRDAIAAGVRDGWHGVWGPGGWRAGVMMRKLGASAGLSNGFETIGFAAMMMMAGTLGIAALDAYSISHNLVSTVFMIGLGLSVATGVRVGQAIGAGQPREATVAGWTGMLVTFTVMGAIMVLILIFRESAAGIYTNDPELAARAAVVMGVAAFIFVPDTLQVVMGQANRALGDAWVPLAVYVLSFVVLMIPLGWWLVTHGGWDERGLALSIAVSCALATVLMAWRFQVLTRTLR